MSKCNECGFLALRNKESRQLEETDALYRNEGYVRDNDGGILERIPRCFAMRWRLDRELATFGTEVKTTGTHGIMEHVLGGDPALEEAQVAELASVATKEDVLRLIGRNRECSDFELWQQGFSPKEHREMVNRKEMLQRQEMEAAANKAMRQSELSWVIKGVIVAMIAAIVVAAATVVGSFLVRDTKSPTIVNNIPPAQIVIQSQPTPTEQKP